MRRAGNSDDGLQTRPNSNAHCNGYDVRALRTIVRLRAMDTQKRQEAETILDTYMLALGMI
jgi:uncharacterized protein (UPF0335 family)